MGFVVESTTTRQAADQAATARALTACLRARGYFLGSGGGAGAGEAVAERYCQPRPSPSLRFTAAKPVWASAHGAPPVSTNSAQNGLSFGKHSENWAGSLSTWQTALPRPLKVWAWYSTPLCR